MNNSNNISTMEAINDKVKAIIANKLGINANEISEESNFTNDLGADSLDIVEIIMELEQEFHIELDDSETETIITVGDAIDHINAKLV